MKIGILGGGQLGRMFLQEATNYPFQNKILDPNPQAPCAHLCDEFFCGDFADEQTVVAFGQDCDAIGIEIEHVSVAGLKRLQAMGKRVVPSPEILAIIQDKGLQKQFYSEHKIATAPFYLVNNKTEIQADQLPFVQKLRTGGYDGKGVQVIRDEADLERLWDAPSVIETLCDIDREIALVFVSDGHGDVRMYPLVDMIFDSVLNLVDVVEMPADLDTSIIEQATILGEKLAQAFQGAGVFAVEMFVNRDGEVWVNETACRVHNSGHVSIEACPSSQFDQMLRLLADLPLGSTDAQSCVAMINLIGADGENGEAEIQSLKQIMQQKSVFLHWYGKAQVRSGRKMGHLSITAENLTALKKRVQEIKQTINLTVSAKK